MAHPPAASTKQAAVAALLLACSLSGARASEEATCTQGSPSASAAGAAIRQDVSEGVSLLATRSRRSRRSKVACASLDNHETYFTVDVAIGTPPQIFALVADTGSNSMIVESCTCKEAGYCGAENPCFTGTNKSTTFHFDPKMDEMVLTFGSGDIQAAKCEDVARVAGVEINMTDGILLMTDQALDFGGPFEGILGLGPPQPAKEANEVAEESEEAEINDADMESWDDVFGDDTTQTGGPLHAAADSQRMAGRRFARRARANGSSRLRGRSGASVHEPVGFLEQAQIRRFSICFNDGAAGVLRLDTPEAPLEHHSVGDEHWSLGLSGISVGDDASMVRAPAAPTLDPLADPLAGFTLAEAPSNGTSALCSQDSMLEGQLTPCGAIVDSGTTLMMGPSRHIDALLEAICDGWPRCSQNHTALAKAVEDAKKVITKEYGTEPFEFTVSSKADVLSMVLSDCAAWLEDGDLDELPAIHFHTAGNGSQQIATIPAHTWVIDSMVEETVQSYTHIDGLGDIPASTNGTGKMVRTCSHSFDYMEYETKLNGPIFILGTPLFYEYMVGYDLKAKTVSLTSQQQEPCGACDGKAGLITSRAEATGKKRAPRRQLGKPRRPRIDVGRPL